jgi:hypothetical protein
MAHFAHFLSSSRSHLPSLINGGAGPGPPFPITQRKEKVSLQRLLFKVTRGDIFGLATSLLLDGLLPCPLRDRLMRINVMSLLLMRVSMPPRPSGICSQTQSRRR